VFLTSPVASVGLDGAVDSIVAAPSRDARCATGTVRASTRESCSGEAVRWLDSAAGFHFIILM